MRFCCGEPLPGEILSAPHHNMDSNYSENIVDEIDNSQECHIVITKCAEYGLCFLKKTLCFLVYLSELDSA